MRNSIVENQFNDDLTIRNYMALLACILNPKLSHNKSLKLFDISDKSEIKFDKENNTLKKSEKNVYKNYRKIKVMDTLNNEELIFNSVYEAESYTGIKKENIYVYIQRQILGKRRYKFSYYKI